MKLAPGIVLVDCARFGCPTMTLSSCVKRYRQGSQPTRVLNAKNGDSTTHTAGCRGCPQGAGRAGR